VGRDTLIGPGSATLDVSILKNTALTERLKLQLRGEFFNVLNHANFRTPNTIVFSSASSRRIADGGSDHIDLHAVAANSNWLEIDLVGPSLYQ
jgi:hypothetical protein